ncbi:MAG: hypothetical protein M3Q51_04480 [Pseudomonadota bacterium]|nr:hypothetical protein [Pseudomonadota bacterium]
MSARPESAAVAGICFLACIAIVALTYLSTLLTKYGPLLREFIHWLLTPQMVIGVMLAYVLLGIVTAALVIDDRRNAR